jgi:hypothetical protein
MKQPWHRAAFKNGQHVVIGAVVSLAAGCVLWMAIAVYTAEGFAYMCCEVQEYKLAGLAVFFVGVIAAAGCDAMFGSINRAIEVRPKCLCASKAMRFPFVFHGPE